MIDQQVSADLAALGRDGQLHVPAIDDLLRGLGEERRAVAPAGGLALMPIANLYADRVARAAGGAAALLLTVVLMVVASPLEIPSFDGASSLAFFLSRLVITSRLELSSLALLVIAGTMLIARRIAARELEHELQRAPDLLAVARRRTQRVDGWSTTLWIVGVSSLLAVIVSLLYATGITWLGAYREVDWVVHGVPTRPVLVELYEAGAIAIACAIAAGFAIARRRPRVLERRAWAWSCTAVALAVVSVGVHYKHSLIVSLQWEEAPWLSLRMVLEVIGAASVLGAIAGFALRCRRRELTCLDAGAPAGDELALFPLAATLADRAARAGGGAAMVLGALWLFMPAALSRHGNHPFFESFESFDRVTRPLLVFALGLGARVLARSRARRTFESGDRSAALGLASSLDRPAVALAIAGSATFVILFGTSWSERWDLWETSRLVGFKIAIAVAIVIASIAAVGVARACNHRWLAVVEHCAVTVIGGIVAIGVAWVAVQADESDPAILAQVVGVVAAFVAITSHVLRRRRREAM